MSERTSRPWVPLVAAFVAVAVLEVALLVAWGSPPPLHDELGYVKTGQEVAAWLQGEGEPSALGRVAWHNPGYASVFVVGELLPGGSGLFLRLLQAFAGLLTGLLAFHGLRRRLPRRWALAGAAVLWLHPSMLFFRLALWPVALATLLTTAVMFCCLRLAEAPDDVRRQRELGLVLAPLPFFAPQALALLPGLLLWPGWRRSARVLAPTLLLWIPWMFIVSATLGTFSPMDLAGPSNVVLGNHPAIAEGRGSLWGDPQGKAVLESEVDEACPDRGRADRVRCEAAWSAATARRTVAEAPAAALARGALRLKETWEPDRFLVRHLRELERGPPGLLAPLMVGLHVLLLACALLGLMTREGRLALAGAALWCAPVLLTVGFTRLRQPLLPWLVLAATCGVHAAVRRDQRPAPEPR
jgi:hypothetical protein